MTREEFRGALSDIDEGGRLSHSEEARKAEILLLDHDKEQRAEIARLREWQRIVLGTGTDQEAVIRMAAAEYTQVAVQTWKQAYHALMGKAVRFAECLQDKCVCQTTEEINERGDCAFVVSRGFLASPEVQAWREQEEQK